MTADGIIRAGFWMQILLLGLLDLASLFAFARQSVAWYHYGGFVAVNVLLIALSVVMWRWMRERTG